MFRRHVRTTHLAALFAALLMIAAGCSDAGSVDPAQAEAQDEPADDAGQQEGERRDADEQRNAAQTDHVVEIDLTGHELEVPDEIPSGWVTFRLHNRTDQTHFGLIDLLPEGITVEDSESDVVPVFQEAMDLINAGEADAGFAHFENLPAWYADVVMMGGPGLVAPGEIAETTVKLEPGTYALECYVKDSAGVFHTTHGMITGFTVTDEASGASEPEADIEVTLSSEDGFTIDGDFRPGRQTVAVHFEDQTLHGNQLGHDVHIAELASGRPDGQEAADPEEIAAWMSWITGLETPAPARFLGGTHEMPEGSVAYLNVTLEPGRYVLVAEVDDPASKNMLRTFDVPVGSDAGAADAVAHYALETDLASSVDGAPSLQPVGDVRLVDDDDPSGEASAEFATDGGLALDVGELITSDTYTLAFRFYLDADNRGWLKLLDLDDRQADRGFYAYKGGLQFYGHALVDGRAPIGGPPYATVVLRRDAAEQLSWFVDGEHHADVDDSERDQGALGSDTLNFFVDDTLPDDSGGEHSSGRMAWLSVYDEALSDEVIAELTP